MRKCRFLINDLEEEDLFDFEADDVFSFMEDFEVDIPMWASLLFVYVRFGVVSISFFEDPEDLFYWHSKIVFHALEDIRFFAFTEINGTWKRFTPPTLIGPHLETRLRE